MNEQNVIAQRIKEVKADNTRLREELAANESELAELEVAANVVARLTGGLPARPAFSGANVVVAKKSDGLPTMPELITMALKQEKRPMEPREITDVIRRNWWPEVQSKKIGSIVWRMHNRDDLVKIEGTSTYRLPQKAEPPDEKLGGDTSRGSLFDPDPEAQGVKATPGGGP